MDSEKKSVLDVVKKYTQTVNNADTRPDLIEDLWEQSEDVSIINPRGHQKGFSRIVKEFYPPLVALLSKRDLNVVGEPSVYIFDNTAIVEFYWKLDATLRDNGQAVELLGRETHVMRKRNGQWKLVHLHYSGMPVEGF